MWNQPWSACVVTCAASVWGLGGGVFLWRKPGKMIGTFLVGKLHIELLVYQRVKRSSVKPENWLVLWNMNGLFSIINIWDVIRNPLTNSIIFQDCRYTTNQLSYFFFRIKRWKAPSLFNSWLCYQRCFIVLHGIRLALPRRAGQSPWPAMEMVGFSSHVRWDRKSMRTTTSNRDVLACPIFRHSFFSFFLFLFALACSCATDVLIGCEHFI
jgi:hypothetical protein